MTHIQQNVADEVHRRTIAFEHSFGNEAFFEDGMIKSLSIMERICSIYFGEDNAAKGFGAMVGPAFGREDGSANWRELMEEEFCGIYSETQLGNLVHDMTAYADYGIVLALARDPEQREALLSGQVEQASDLLDVLPTEFWGLQSERLVQVLSKAKVRWKLDNGEHLDAVELALISGRALQTIKNKLAGDYAEIHGNQRRIDADEAKAWLAAQADFFPSIWRQQDDRDILPEADRGLGEVVFVPVAKDGSIFHPGVVRDGRYLVDKEGAERGFDNFDAALAALQSMFIPQWRRPTDEGIWTRVRGVDWRRMEVEHLNSMAKKAI